MGMTQTMIEDENGTTAEVTSLGGDVELAMTDANATAVSIVLSPRAARQLARQLLAQADAEEHGDEG